MSGKVETERRRACNLRRNPIATSGNLRFRLSPAPSPEGLPARAPLFPPTRAASVRGEGNGETMTMFPGMVPRMPPSPRLVPVRPFASGGVLPGACNAATCLTVGPPPSTPGAGERWPGIRARNRAVAAFNGACAAPSRWAAAFPSPGAYRDGRGFQRKRPGASRTRAFAVRLWAFPYGDQRALLCWPPIAATAIGGGARGEPGCFPLGTRNRGPRRGR